MLLDFAHGEDCPFPSINTYSVRSMRIDVDPFTLPGSASCVTAVAPLFCLILVNQVAPANEILDKVKAQGFAELGSEGGDTDADGVGHFIQVVPPDMAHEFLLADRPAPVEEEILQNIGFPPRQLNLLALDAGLSCLGIKSQARGGNHLVGQDLFPPEEGPNTGFQLLKVKGLDQIVVGSQVQAPDPVFHLRPGSEKDDIDSFVLLPNGFKEAKAVLAWQVDVEEDEVVIFCKEKLFGNQAICGRVHNIGGQAEKLR